MADSLSFSVNAIFPIILITLTGVIARKTGIFTEKFLDDGNKFCFKYGYLALMFVNIYNIETLDQIRWHTIAVALAGIAVLFIAGLIYVKYAVQDVRQKGVVHQAFYRSNYATIGIPLAGNLCGNAGIVSATLISAIIAPLFNILAVISLTMFQEKKQNGLFKYMVKQVALNPLIQGVAAGLVCLAIRPFCGGWRFSTGCLSVFYKAIESVAVITPTLSLLVLGGRFHISAIRKMFRMISVSTAARLILAPVIGLGISLALSKCFTPLNLSNADFAALFALFAGPQSVTSVSMADQMDSDSDLAGQILVWTTLFSSITLVILAAVFRALGLF